MIVKLWSLFASFQVFYFYFFNRTFSWSCIICNHEPVFLCGKVRVAFPEGSRRVGTLQSDLSKSTLPDLMSDLRGPSSKHFSSCQCPKADSADKYINRVVSHAGFWFSLYLWFELFCVYAVVQRKVAFYF